MHKKSEKNNSAIRNAKLLSNICKSQIRHMTTVEVILSHQKEICNVTAFITNFSIIEKILFLM